jgi:hypothetical protein
MINDLINASISNKKVITTDLTNILNEISPEQRNELKSLLTNLKGGNAGVTQVLNNEFFAGEQEFVLLPSIIKNNTKVNKKEAKELILNEYGVFLGIVMGKSKDKDVFKMMQEYSDCLIINEKISSFSTLFFYRDLDIAFCFDENSIIREVTLGKKFKGKTSKGLRIYDNISRAFKLYGMPKQKQENTISVYTWDNFLIFSEDTRIIQIRFI